VKLHGEGARIRTIWRPFVIKKYLESTDIPRLHIGCGGKNIKGWLNVDKFAANADTFLNAEKRFPFEDDTFKYIYSEHMIEHLRINKVKGFLEEVYRVLKPGGIFRVTCPDLELFVDQYKSGDKAFFEELKKPVDWKGRKHPDLTWVVRSNGAIFMSVAVKEFHKHRWMYDFETLESCLREVGFKNIRKKSFQQSESSELSAMDNKELEYCTLYIEGEK